VPTMHAIVFIERTIHAIVVDRPDVPPVIQDVCLDKGWANPTGGHPRPGGSLFRIPKRRGQQTRAARCRSFRLVPNAGQAPRRRRTLTDILFTDSTIRALAAFFWLDSRPEEGTA
jgi:hypothetical protein